MPRKYKRKSGVVPRNITWTEENLAKAFEEMKKKIMGVNEISRIYGIPSRTLRRRYEKNNQELLTQGRFPVLGFDHEKRLVAHILKLGDAGFPPDRDLIRQLAYQFAEKLGLKHNFNDETQMAGKQWLKSFLERNTEITVRQAEGLSLERAKGLNRAEVVKFFTLLTTVLTEHDLLDKPNRIFNMDETGVQLNNKPSKVLAKKGTRAVKSLTSGEKGETITVVACCNAIGNFLPPVLIIKGVNKKPEFEEGLPTGSKVFMQKKSAYITSELFYKWLTEHFITYKPHGKVLLILDGHSSHSSAVNMLEAARDNDIILLCLPSHTTSALQPLDRAVFGPFKKFYFKETNHFMRINPQKKLNRYNSGQLIANAWMRATTPGNAISGFRGSGIYPIDPNALPDSEFTISDIALGEVAQERNSNLTSDQPQSVSEELTLGEHAQEIWSEQRSTPNEQYQVPHLDEQVPGVSGETTPGKRTQETESDQRLAPHGRNQVLDLNDQILGVSGDSPSCERTQECEAAQSLVPNERDQVPSLDDQVLGVIDVDQLDTALHEPEQSSVHHHHTPSLSPSLLNLSHDYLSQIDIDIENYLPSGTELSFPSMISLNDSNKIQQKNIEKETPSKYLQESSPIPKIPLSMTKRAKQSAEVLNSDENIIQKKNKKEKTKNVTETKTCMKQKDKTLQNKPTHSKTQITKKKGQPKEKIKTKQYTNTSSSSDIEIDDTDYIKLNEKRTSRKRQKVIYSSDSENENITKTHKGKITKGLQVKKSVRHTKRNLKVRDTNTRSELEKKKPSIDDICIECFDNYHFTKSKSDWIVCNLCGMWLHETCSVNKYCTRCGKLNALVS